MKNRLFYFLILGLPISAFAANSTTNNAIDEYNALANFIDYRIELLYALRIVIAFVFGAIIGLTHNKHNKTIGFRVFTAVSMGSSIKRLDRYYKVSI